MTSESTQPYLPRKFRGRFLQLATDLTGIGSPDPASTSRNLAVNGSVTPAYFTGGPGLSDRAWCLTSLAIAVQLTGDPDMSEFGNLSALANGLAVGIYDEAGSLVAPLYGGYTIKTNGDLYRLAYYSGRGGPGQGGGAVDQIIRGTLDLADNTAGIKIESGDGHKVGITVQDNLSTLPFVSAWITAHEITA